MWRQAEDIISNLGVCSVPKDWPSTGIDFVLLYLILWKIGRI